MSIQPGELAVQRALTQAFVAADASTLTLWRSEWQNDGAGGVVRLDPEPLAPQQLRLQPREDGGSPRTTADGEQVVPTYTLIGLHTADMKRWDTFAKDGVRYELAFVYENTQYEVKAEVFYHGR